MYGWVSCVRCLSVVFVLLGVGRWLLVGVWVVINVFIFAYILKGEDNEQFEV